VRVKAAAKGKAKPKAREASSLEKFVTAAPEPPAATGKLVHQPTRISVTMTTKDTTLSSEQSSFKARFDQARKRHVEIAGDMAVGHCATEFAAAVVYAFLGCDRDTSDELMRPLLAHNIFAFPIKEKHLLDICEPLFEALGLVLMTKLENERLFAILATMLNFGQQLSDHASLFTSVHTPVLSKLSTFITDALKQLADRLDAPIIASFESGSFSFADEDAMGVVLTHTQTFLSSCKAYGLLEQIVQAIVVNTCIHCDAFIFNLIVVTADEFTDEKLSMALQHVRELQKQLNCLSQNFNAAFSHLLELITDAELVLSGVPIIPKKTMLMRAIIERCQPPVTLPTGVTLDDIGPPAPSWDALRVPIPTFQFAFTFEWLYLEAGRAIGRTQL
jgi:hypothetical protein